MIRTLITCLLSLNIVLLFGQSVDQRTNILFLLDASSSMQKKWQENSRWGSATNILNQQIAAINDEENVEIGLRVYGHQHDANERICTDSKLEVTIGPNNATYIKAKLKELKPRGITPIGYTLEKTVNDFAFKKGRNVIVLITDGEESCEADPCVIVKSLQRNNVILKPFVVGLGMPENTLGALNCLGEVYNAQTTNELKEYLTAITTRILSKTTIQVNLNNLEGIPTETAVNMTFYDMESGLPKYNFYHSFNDAGQPDTFFVDPVYTYRIVVHTIPAIEIFDVKLAPNQHNVVSTLAAQGDLYIDYKNAADKAIFGRNMKCLVAKNGTYETILLTKLLEKERLLVGSYDLEILSLPRISMDAVEIEQNTQTQIRIPEPGLLTLNKGFEVFGGIFVYEGSRLRKIYDLKADGSQEKLELQPGKYRLVYRPKFSKTMHTTVDKEFEIKSAKIQTIKL